MSSNASDYAESVSRGHWEAANTGAPFGLAECEECGTAPGDSCEHDTDRTPADAIDWIDEQLDISYLVDSNGNYRSARILVTFGGPNAIVDTDAGALIVTWGSDTATRSLPGDMIAAIDDAAAELWDNVR